MTTHCQHCGKPLPVRSRHWRARTYCNRSCACAATRARQTPERRAEIARLGHKGRVPDWQVRLLARVKVFADDQDSRIVLAYRFGRMALKSARHRAKGQPVGT